MALPRLVALPREVVLGGTWEAAEVALRRIEALPREVALPM